MIKVTKNEKIKETGMTVTPQINISNVIIKNKEEENVNKEN